MPSVPALGPRLTSGDVRKFGADCRFGIVHWWAVLDRLKNWIGYMDIALIVHEIAVHGSYLLIAGHVSAALWHRNQRDGIWNAMVPILARAPRK